MAGKIKKETAGSSPDPEGARLQKQTTAVNEALMLSSMHQHELTETAEKLNAQLQAEIAERKKTEAALGESERETKRERDYAEATLRTAPIPLLVLRADLRVNTANDAFYKNFEVAPAETEGALIYDLGNRQWNIPKLRELLEDILPKNNFFNNFEITHEFETIGRRTMLLNARRMENEAGQPLRIVLAIEDITERKQTEEKLRESELETKRARDYAEATLRTAPIPLLVLEDDLRVNTANDAFYKNFQVAPAETEGALIYDLGNRQWNIPKLRELLEDILPKNNFFNDYEITHEFETIGRRTMLLNARRMENEAGQPLRIVLAIEDITERKQASQYARSLLEASLDPLVTINAEGKITDVNEGSIKVTGVAREKLIGTDFSDYFTEPEKAREGYQQVFAKGFVTDYPLTIRHKDGRLTDVLYNASVYKDVRGNVLGVFAAARDITERNRAEEALRKSEVETKRARDYAEATLRTAPIPLLVLEDDLRVNTANDAFYKNFQVKPAETEGELIYDLGNRQWNIPKLRELLEEILPKNNFFNDYEITHQFETIGRRTMLLNARRMENEAGQPLRIVLAIEDITERKQAEEKLRESEMETERARDYAEATLRTAPIPLLVLEDDLRVNTANDAFYKNFQVKPAETEGCFVYEIGNGQWNIPKLHELLEDILPHHSWFEGFEVIHEFETIGRRTMLLNARRMENEAGQPLRIVLAIEDITERKQAEEALRESEERLRFMAESMPQKIFTAKPNGDIDYFNRQWLEFTGLSFEQIRDWGWLQFIHPEDVEENIRRWQHSIDTREPFYMEHRFLRIDGEYRWHVSRAVPMLDAEGKTLMWIGSNTEIEEIRQAREKTERASRAKDEFLAALSHELRTPLTPVLMSAAALQHDDRLPRDVRDQLSMMERNIELEARLIDDLLDLTRIAHGKLLLRTQPCDAHSLIALAVEMVRSDAQGKGQTMEIDLAAERSHVTGDPARLQQVFWNLLKNAVKFTPESGRLSVRSRDLADRLELEISDSGIGISADAIERIFLPFEQAGAISADHRVPGLGLGLSIARAILDLHGGSIQAESGGLGQGATFRVELPATETPLGALPESDGQSAGRTGSDSRRHRATAAPLRLLLVEDHQSTLEVLERMLTRAGHRVATAISVSGALKLAGAGRFDAVISDLGLPDGTGFELMEKLRAAYGLRGIALSGYGMDEDRLRSNEAGFGAHLTKPIDFAQLERALEDVMAQASPASG